MNKVLIFASSVIIMLLLTAGCSSDNSTGSSSKSTSNDTANDLSISESCTGVVDSFRTDITNSGNRVSGGNIDLLSAEFTDVALEGQPVWVVPYDGLGSWYVTLESGEAV